MRRIVSITHTSIDGVIQAPGGPDEDPAGGFRHGGWSVPFRSDQGAEFITTLMSRDFDLLLGRKTYDIFASFWPNQPDGPVATPFNAATKYVVSRSPRTLHWQNSIQVEGDAIEGVRQLKGTDGPELHIWGTSELGRDLLQTDLIDEVILLTHPVVLGSGKRRFDPDAMASSFTLTHTSVTDDGVIIAGYQRAGDVRTG
jgi:dihydrofolate reductase